MASAQEENQISARYFVQVRHAEILGYIKLQLNPCNRNAISSSCTISLHVYVYAIILIHVRIPARKHYCPPPPPLPRAHRVLHEFVRGLMMSMLELSETQSFSSSRSCGRTLNFAHVYTMRRITCGIRYVSAL